MRSDLFRSLNSFYKNNVTKKDTEIVQKTRKRDTKIINFDKQTKIRGKQAESIPPATDEKEEQADVQEITTTKKNSNNEMELTTTVTSNTVEVEVSTESTEKTTVTQATTQIDEMTTTDPPPTPAVTEPDSQGAGSAIIDNAIIEIIDTNLQQIYGFYFGGQPNPDADFTYFTTTESSQGESVTTELSSSEKPKETPELIHNSDVSASSRNFKPSIRYEYKNYRYDVDEHFVPIVGLKQVF